MTEGLHEPGTGEGLGDDGRGRKAGGPDRPRLQRRRLGRPPAGDGDFDVLSRKGAGERRAHWAETDDRMAHDNSPVQYNRIWGLHS